MAINLTDFYNHEKFMTSVQQGMQLVNNTDFEGFKKQRMQALKNFNINDIVVDESNQLYKVVDTEEDNLVVVSMLNITKTGRIKKNATYRYLNPVHCKVYTTTD